MQDMIRSTIIMMVITIIAGAALGQVHSATLEPIAVAAQNKKDAACQVVFESAAGFVPSTADSASFDAVLTEYPGVSIDSEIIAANDASGNTLGYVLNVVDHNGYAGDIRFLMGIRADGTLNGIALLSISETPGLGMKAGEVLVPQFAEKQVPKFSVTKTGSKDSSEIDAISGATITSRAVTDGVNAGLLYFSENLKE